MKDRILAIGMVVVISLSGLFSLSPLIGGNTPMALAAPGRAAPTVTAVTPNEAPNDLDITVVISGEGFGETPTVYLGETELTEVTWVSETEVSAVVPWGMDPGLYALTVEIPDGETAALVGAFTVTQGIGVWTTGGPYGGSVYALQLGDSKGPKVYATINGVGLFRSQDGGDSWKLNFIFTNHINELAVDPNNPDHLYFFRSTLYQSLDGGDHWSAMPEPLPGTGVSRFLAFISPHDGTVYGGMFHWVLNPSCEWGCGLFRFDEKNQTWERLGKSGLLDENTGVTAVGFDPVDPNIIYAGLIGGLVVKSEDGGETWSKHSEAPIDYIKQLVVNPVSGEVWLCGPGAYLDGGLYKYSGGNWISSAPNGTTLIKKIIFDRLEPNVWIAAGDGGLYKSDDGGGKWNLLTSIRTETVALNPQQPMNIYIGTNEGVMKTNDGGINWQAVNEGLAGIVPEHLGVNPQNPAVVYGISGSGGILGSFNGGNTWEKMAPPSAGPILVDPNNTERVVNAAYDVVLIAEDGRHFDKQVSLPMPQGKDRPDYSVISTAMIARPGLWVLGGGYQSRLVPYWNFDGGGGIYLSNDGEKWTLVTSPLLNCPPNSLAFDPVDPKIIYGVTGGFTGGEMCEVKFVKTTNGGETWSEYDTNLPIDFDPFITAEPTPPNRIFMAGAGRVYVSSDHGVSWDEVSGFIGSGVSAMLFLQGSPSILYAGTHHGLFRSNDGGQTWQRAQGVLGQLETFSLAGAATEDGRHIVYAATIGGVEDVEEITSSGLRESSDALVNAGVYRLTTVFPPVFNLYLPLLAK